MVKRLNSQGSLQLSKWLPSTGISNLKVNLAVDVDKFDALNEERGVWRRGS